MFWKAESSYFFRIKFWKSSTWILRQPQSESSCQVSNFKRIVLHRHLLDFNNVWCFEKLKVRIFRFFSFLKSSTWARYVPVWSSMWLFSTESSFQIGIASIHQLGFALGLSQNICGSSQNWIIKNTIFSSLEIKNYQNPLNTTENDALQVWVALIHL